MLVKNVFYPCSRKVPNFSVSAQRYGRYFGYFEMARAPLE
jgi:hypothetical protein